MQVKIIAVPAMGGEAMNEQLNVFLRSKKILQVERRLVTPSDGGAYWSFCIHYTEDYSPVKMKERVDYKAILDESAFERFSRFREIRKEVASREQVPPYAVFTDEELSELAKFDVLTQSAMKSVKGIGEKKTEKYGVYFIPPSHHDQG
ncbi:MAG: HRDC domain-containing protein [Saprospiraceae bacterium]|nr:HRDC domain-containing protein [Saprospiraceae bacterium]